MKNNIQDMTFAAPFKLILKFTLPMMLVILFQQFYSIVDTAIVGRYIGVNALAAVGSVSSLNFIIVDLCNGLCSGCCIPNAPAWSR